MQYKSIIVYTAFTDIACDYYVRHSVTDSVVKYLKLRGHSINCRIDSNYDIPRKELAVRVGLGKIAYNGLLYDDIFGFEL